MVNHGTGVLSNSQIDGGEGRVGKQQSQRELAATQERKGRRERKEKEEKRRCRKFSNEKSVSKQD